MLILAFDASLARCSAALLRGTAVLAERAAIIRQGQPARLPELAAEVMAGLEAGSLDAVAAVVGPGSFTGIRTALALAQGIALAAERPALGVTTGEALAAALPGAAEVWAVLDTRRGGMFLERLRDGVPLAPPATLAERALPAPDRLVHLAGDAAAAAAARLSARGHAIALTDERLPWARHVGWVGARRLAGEVPPLALRPLYVEPPAVR
jgi:tRNA threonylcarbamoyladenosine biosynthesis protein TsaB